jgi:hypothetical protein
MMTIDEEVKLLINFLSHPAGFDVGMGGTLQIRPIDENSPPEHWEVDWEEEDDNLVYEYAKEFSTLKAAVQFFVEKRHFMCSGLDFEVMLSASDPDVEISE